DLAAPAAQVAVVVWERGEERLDRLEGGGDLGGDGGLGGAEPGFGDPQLARREFAGADIPVEEGDRHGDPDDGASDPLGGFDAPGQSDLGDQGAARSAP